MKTRIQMMLGLLFIAITISMIGISFAWFTATPAEMHFNGTSVSITTAENNLDGSVTSLNYLGCLSTSDYNSFTLKDYTPYRGEDGISSQYILIVEALDGIYTTQSSGYVNICELSVEVDGYDEPIEYADGEENDFEVVVLESSDRVNFTRMEESDEEQLCYFFAIIFKAKTVTTEVDGETVTAQVPFVFSDRKFMGTSFKINILIK